MPPFPAAVDAVRPVVGVVFGSGLSDAASPFVPVASVPFADLPGLVPPTVAGHRGRVSVGHWVGVPAVVSFGRVHFYEGHPWSRVTRLVELFAEWGVKTLILTNAAGGIRSDLQPGDLMAIRGHVKWLGGDGWNNLTPPAPLSQEERGVFKTVTTLSSPRALRAPEAVDARNARGEDQERTPFEHPPLHDGEGGRGGEVSAPNPYTLLAPSLPSGIYAALTGPCYETPAEIRALRAIGADAVGMSTAMEAEAAASLGLAVAGISCITNKAAGLAAGTLSHHEVEAVAKLAVAKLAAVISGLIGSETSPPGPPLHDGEGGVQGGSVPVIAASVRALPFVSRQTGHLHNLNTPSPLEGERDGG